MKPALTFLIVLSVCGSAAFSQDSQDLKVREEAVRLLERADAVSSSPKLPNLERVDTFRAYGDSGMKEGTFSRVVIQGVGRREEFSLGDFHLVKVWTQRQLAMSGSAGTFLPAELMQVLRITPVWRVRFDGEDVIHTISDRNISGAAARCIEFDTIRGQKTDNNEICVDTKTGAMVLQRLAGEVIEYGDFFQFAGAHLPGKIVYSRSSGTQKIEITQTMTELGGADANVLAPPPNASLYKACTTFRRAFGVSMPQPAPGTGSQEDDIVVRAMIGMDGRVSQATVQSSDRPDLNEEALGLARQWTFTPSMCDGHPNGQEVDITLHFQGR